MNSLGSRASVANNVMVGTPGGIVREIRFSTSGAKGGVAGVTAAPLAPLVGGGPITDISAAIKRIANFWPYSTTVFDYIRRSMPWQQPMTLSNDEVYALTAYILALNKLVGDNDTMNAQTLPKVKMPNRDGFIPRFPEAM